MDFFDMVEFHKKSGSDISIATIPVTEREAPEFGILKANEKHEITSFIEKPKKEMLPDWISDTGNEMKDQGKLYLASISKYKVASFQYDGYWTDIGNIHSFFEANLSLTLELPPFNLFDNNKIVYSRPRMLPPAKISGTVIEQTIFAEGCIINASRLESSVIGIRTRIGAGTEIVSSYIMGSDYYETLQEIKYDMERKIPKIGIGDNCYIKNAIVDKNCRIG